MNRHLVLIAIVLIAGATAYSFMSLERTLEGNRAEPDSLKPEHALSPALPAPETGDNDERKRRAAMRAEYDRLEQARDAVRKQLGILNSRLWKLRLPPDRAREIQEQMQQGHALLKNPPLLGAFSGTDEIAGETGKVSEVNVRLKALEEDVEKLLSVQQSR